MSFYVDLSLIYKFIINRFYIFKSHKRFSSIPCKHHISC